jgi:hypothetical protein
VVKGKTERGGTTPVEASSKVIVDRVIACRSREVESTQETREENDSLQFHDAGRGRERVGQENPLPETREKKGMPKWGCGVVRRAASPRFLKF